MSFYIMNDSLPSWTDVAQVFIGLAGMVAALWTLIKLVSRDKQRESEIASLSAIATQLKDLQLLNEKRHIESKKPHIEITCKKDFNLGGNYFLYFKNLNSYGQITKYERFPKLAGMVSSPANFGTEQDFAFSITPPSKEGGLKLLMTYTIEDIYQFEQEIVVYYKQDILTVRGFPIGLKK